MDKFGVFLVSAFFFVTLINIADHVDGNVILYHVAATSPKIIPGFKKIAHGVSSGPATILDTKRILIKNLKYDGAGPDAYFWVGKGATPNSKGVKIQNEYGSSDPIRGYEGRDVELTLPGLLTWNDIDYLSIYCVAFDENFGHILIPQNLNVPPYSEV